MLKNAPLSTISGTGVPLRPTVAIARWSTIFTGNSITLIAQPARAAAGAHSASATLAKASARGAAARRWISVPSIVPPSNRPVGAAAGVGRSAFA